MEDSSKVSSGVGNGHSRGLHSYVHRAAQMALIRPSYKPYFKLRKARAKAAMAAAAVPSTFDVPALCAAYNWPPQGSVPGGGVIAIVELGGGWKQSDMVAFFKSINQPIPNIVDVPNVDGSGTSNQPDPNPGPDSPDYEVALDIQVAAAAYYAATGKPATIRVYWAGDIAPAVRAATSDGCDVCSISWGSDEAKWEKAAKDEMEQAAYDAVQAGMIVFAASGDNDSSDGGPNPADVDLPSACTSVLGCGGTRKTANDETVWNNNPGQTNGEGTGGGYSTYFPRPDWQANAPTPPRGRGRMVPDVAADADPETGYNIYLNGPTSVGGTSAVAPLYAGLFASFGTKLGFITTDLYQNEVCFNDITEGDNGAYRALSGLDPCTGLGSPIGDRLAQKFAQPSATAARALRKLKAENADLRQMLAAHNGR